MIIAVLAATTWWIPAFLRLLNLVEANSELIDALAGLTQILTFVMGAISIVLVYLGYKNVRNANSGEVAQQAVNVAEGGRGTAIGGDVGSGAAVFVGDHNQVQFFGNVTYEYDTVAPSQVDPDVLGSARQRLEDLPVDEVSGRGALPLGSVMPLRPNRYFVGREEQLTAIASNLQAGTTTTISEVTVAASSGLGGVGKTQLACEFVYRYGQFFHGVYWLSFAEPDGIPAEVASCGGAEGMNLRPDFHTLPLEERVRAVMAEWQGELPRLLVFDNCEHEGLLDRWLPPTGGCRVLVTSRGTHWDPSLGVIDLPLDVFSRQESLALLRKHRPDLPTDSPELHAIAEDLGDLPLALDLAGRYLDKYRHEITPATYLAEIRQPDLLKHPSLRQARGISPTKHDMDVWRTFALSYWRLDANDDTDRTAIRLLARAARLAPGEPIPGILLAWTLNSPYSDDVAPQLTTTIRDALNKLTELGLLETSGGEALRMHRLVAAFARTEITDKKAQPAVEMACARASEKAHREGQPARQEELLPHVRFVTDSAMYRADEMTANLCMALDISLSQLGAYDEALPYAERAWEISIRLYKPEDRIILQRRSNMGLVFEGKGDRVQARAIYEEVLEAQERRYGQQEPDVAATLNNLGASFARDDLYHETLPLYRRALRIREGVWERTRPDDPNRQENAYELAESYGNMGQLLMDLGRHEEAEPHLMSALAILADEVGQAHERNAGTLVSLGRALRARRAYPQAVSSIESALTTYENIGIGYTRAVADALANAGATYKEAEEVQMLPASLQARILEQANGALHGALNGSEQMYGEDHPMTGGILRVLAEVCEAQGYTEDGRRYRERAEANRQKNFQSEGVDAASVLNMQGRSLTNQGLRRGIRLPGASFEHPREGFRKRNFEYPHLPPEAGHPPSTQGSRRSGSPILGARPSRSRGGLWRRTPRHRLGAGELDAPRLVRVLEELMTMHPP